MITSAQNTKIQWVKKLSAQKKERDASGSYVIEGVRSVEEAFASGAVCRLFFYTAPLTERARVLVSYAEEQGIPAEEITESLMKSVSDTATPQGALAVMEKSPLPIPDMVDFILLLDTIRDPGNLGTLFRTAAAAGVDLVILSPGCADPYAPKVIRSAMGGHFKVPFWEAGWAEIEAVLGRFPGLQVLAADMDGGRSCWDTDFSLPTALVIGSEADGISADALALTTGKVFIPMPGKIESLNAAMAAGILIFEVVRQRQGH